MSTTGASCGQGETADSATRAGSHENAVPRHRTQEQPQAATNPSQNRS